MITQPSSSLIVYALGVFAIFNGATFLKRGGPHLSALWWGIAMFLWGIGAIMAGTSYEGLAWHLKCEGREYCLWTTWLEVLYSLLSVACFGAITIACSYSCAGKLKRPFQVWAGLSVLVYATLLVYGVVAVKPFLLSFTMLVSFIAPSVLVITLLNLWRYSKERGCLEGLLLRMWAILGVTIVAYYGYLESGLTRTLYSGYGIWFSQDDILHSGLIIMMGWIRWRMFPTLRDEAPAGLVRREASTATLAIESSTSKEGLG